MSWVRQRILRHDIKNRVRAKLITELQNIENFYTSRDTIKKNEILATD